LDKKALISIIDEANKSFLKNNTNESLSNATLGLGNIAEPNRYPVSQSLELEDLLKNWNPKNESKH